MLQIGMALTRRRTIFSLWGAVALSPAAPVSDHPNAMYNGANEIIEAREKVTARGVYGVVKDPSGTRIHGATVQVQMMGEERLVYDGVTDKKGRFYLPKLPAGPCWIGFSKIGFSLLYWTVRISPSATLKRLRVALPLGV